MLSHAAMSLLFRAWLPYLRSPKNSSGDPEYGVGTPPFSTDSKMRGTAKPHARYARALHRIRFEALGSTTWPSIWACQLSRNPRHLFLGEVSQSTLYVSQVQDSSRIIGITRFRRERFRSFGVSAGSMWGQVESKF